MKQTNSFCLQKGGLIASGSLKYGDDLHQVDEMTIIKNGHIRIPRPAQTPNGKGTHTVYTAYNKAARAESQEDNYFPADDYPI